MVEAAREGSWSTVLEIMKLIEFDTHENDFQCTAVVPYCANVGAVKSPVHDFMQIEDTCTHINMCKHTDTWASNFYMFDKYMMNVVCLG